MASIVQVGERWRAQIRRKGYPSQARTFDTKKEAEAWARKVEHGIDTGQTRADLEDMTVGDLVAHFRKMRMDMGQPVRPDSNTRYMLDHLEEDLGHRRLRDLTPADMVSWARHRQGQGAGGYTVNMELSLLGTCIRHVAAYHRVQLPDVVGQARPLLHYAQLISSEARRDRRPTEDELGRLLTWLDGRNRIVADAVRVSAITGLRRSELARIVWEDVDPATRSVLVRKRKHPRRREARDEPVPLLGEAWDIVQAQPEPHKGRVFPVSVETLTDCVTAGTRELGIPDLRLHDMRRHATSTLRELGFDDHARMRVVGHRSEAVHARYVAVDLEAVHQQYAAATRDRPRRLQRQPPASDHPPAATESPPPPGD